MPSYTQHLFSLTLLAPLTIIEKQESLYLRGSKQAEIRGLELEGQFTKHSVLEICDRLQRLLKLKNPPWSAVRVGNALALCGELGLRLIPTPSVRVQRTSKS